MNKLQQSNIKTNEVIDLKRKQEILEKKTLYIKKIKKETKVIK